MALKKSELYSPLWQSVSQTLTGRIRQLAERYASPLPQLTGEVEQLAVRVAGHMKKMGVEA
jgi:type I restriction enzyme M protein